MDTEAHVPPRSPGSPSEPPPVPKLRVGLTPWSSISLPGWGLQPWGRRAGSADVLRAAGAASRGLRACRLASLAPCAHEVQENHSPVLHALLQPLPPTGFSQSWPFLPGRDPVLTLRGVGCPASA